MAPPPESDGQGSTLHGSPQPKRLASLNQSSILPALLHSAPNDHSALFFGLVEKHMLLAYSSRFRCKKPWTSRCIVEWGILAVMPVGMLVRGVGTAVATGKCDEGRKPVRNGNQGVAL